MLARSFIALAVVAALPATVTAQDASVAQAEAVVGSSVARPVVIAPGEEIEWRVDYLGVKTGRARMTVGKPSGDIWPVIAQAKTEGVAKLVEIKEHFVSYWHSGERRSNSNALESLEIGDHRTEQQRFDRAQGKATVTWSRKGKQKQKIVDVPHDVHDLASAMMWLRLQPLEPDTTYEIPVFTGSDLFTMKARVAGRERIASGLGETDTVRVDLELGFKKKFETRRATQVWFTDDARHVPVRMSAEFAIGSVVATATTYTPGNQVAAR
jgi:hypothetical protein